MLVYRQIRVTSRGATSYGVCVNCHKRLFRLMKPSQSELTMSLTSVHVRVCVEQCEQIGTMTDSRVHRTGDCVAHARHEVVPEGESIKLGERCNRSCAS